MNIEVIGAGRMCRPLMIGDRRPVIHDFEWLIRPKSLGMHKGKGKGQRKANKANRWK